MGAYLRRIRKARQLTLRDVERLAKEKKIGAELSSGYLSMLEQDKIKQPSPRILFTLASIYEVDYIDLMKKANYIQDKPRVKGYTPTQVAFRGAAQLNEEQRRHVQRLIDFELSEVQRNKRRKQG